jgi:hypothetical protein
MSRIGRNASIRAILDARKLFSARTPMGAILKRRDPREERSSMTEMPDPLASAPAHPPT